MHYQPDFASLCGRSSNIEEYGRFQQHLVLLQDTLRVGAYHQAIKASARPGRRVAVDVGGGSGVLSLCALKCGYEKVYYIEPSRKMAHYAAHNFARNGFADRAVILNSTLEAVDLAQIAEPIDLIVTETISSLFLGFGCWPAFNALRERLAPGGTVVPFAGNVFGCPWERDMASRHDQNHGLKYLRDIGLDIDLYQRTFWSGGNVFDKTPVNYALAAGRVDMRPMVTLDARAADYCRPLAARFEMRESGRRSGLLSYWTLQLSEFNPAVMLDSRDPRLSAWYPYYIPFSEPLAVQQGDVLELRVQMHTIDSPYPCAFQVCNFDRPVSEMLYW